MSAKRRAVGEGIDGKITVDASYLTLCGFLCPYGIYQFLRQTHKSPHWLPMPPILKRTANPTSSMIKGLLRC